MYVGEMEVRGDLLRWENEDVARISPTLQPTLRDRFEKFVARAETEEQIEDKIDEVKEKLEKLAKTSGGLLTVEEVMETLSEL